MSSPQLDKANAAASRWRSVPASDARRRQQLASEVSDESRSISWQLDEVAFPDLPAETVFAIEVAGEAMMPIYRDGDILVCSPSVPVRRGDRVLLRSQSGDLYGGTLKRKTMHSVDLSPFQRGAADATFTIAETLWVARILWASQ